ncbi:MAG: four helix bundle suffix domain-containing protein [candidate division WWE3 bacterium]|nr:four helix bundle suffix domain-containing protein [candidate division WWE3 bacterium]
MNPIKNLLTYRYSEIIYDLTVSFLSYLSYLGRLNIPTHRTAEQMLHAARSSKQNIVEGVAEICSLKGQLKLLGISYASYEELIADLEDFLRILKLRIYPKTDPRVKNFQQIGYRLSNISNLSNLGNLIEKPILPKDPEEAANFLLTLCHIETYLLKKQIEAAETKFAKEGGYTENLFKKRLEYRSQNRP